MPERGGNKSGKAPKSSPRNRNASPAKIRPQPAAKRPGARPPSVDDTKIVFTRENINSHLVSYTENPKNYKILGMLTYLFKEFGSSPAELLSKLKVLTAGKKVRIAGGRVPELILKHLFATLEMKDGFSANLFNLLRNNTFLSALMVDVYFNMPLEDEEQVQEHLGWIFKELMAIWEEKGQLDFSSFLEEVRVLEESGNLEDKAGEMFGADEEESAHSEAGAVMGTEDSRANAGTYDSSGRAPEKAPEQQDPDGDSSHSLVSLNDDEHISRLDAELGKQFRANVHNPDSDVYSLQLLDCMGKLLKANFTTDLSFLNNLFYLYQFEPLSAETRVLIKVFLGKFNDKRSIFTMYQLAALVIPPLYDLFTVLKTYCADEFDEESFMRIVIKAGHGPAIVNKIDPSIFYPLYSPARGKNYETFLFALIRNEQNQDTLRSLLESSNEEVRACVEERIKSVEWRAAHPRRKRARKAEDAKQKLDGGNAALGECAVATASEPTAEEAPKRRTFAEKVGAKIVDERNERKKKYRWKNYKENKKAGRKMRHEEPQMGGRGINKRLLRDEAASAGSAKKSRKTKAYDPGENDG